MLASECGLTGLSGGQGDVRDIAQAAQAGDRNAQLALGVFVQSVRHYLGAFLVKLGGLDVVTFSGGIGENAAGLRARPWRCCRRISPRSRRRLPDLP